MLSIFHSQGIYSQRLEKFIMGRWPSSGKQVQSLTDESIKNLLEWSVNNDISNDSTDKAFNR
ncbi:MAG: hypothetical protein V7L12_20945 [Nostoc sp.]